MNTGSSNLGAGLAHRTSLGLRAQVETDRRRDNSFRARRRSFVSDPNSKVLLTTNEGRARERGPIARPFALYSAMRTTGHWVIVAVWGAVVLATPIATAEAQQVQAGTLACRGGPDTGFVLGAVTNLDCVLHADSAPDSRYVAAIPNLGIFIGDEEVALIWKVMAPVPWLGLDQLAGSYAHESGAGDNVLTGGTNTPITLLPLTEDAFSTPPVKIESLEIRPMDR